ncbi:MAG: type II toxin-antitoxin system HicA family toxin [Chloroflexi bacterium]|nr:type II toxin-antitoxin system HicA family toxin [Chloroflexota bacterium]
MTKLPVLKVREVVRGLQTLGFERVRQRGSHAIFHHQDCRREGSCRPFTPRNCKAFPLTLCNRTCTKHTYR